MGLEFFINTGFKPGANEKITIIAKPFQRFSAKSRCSTKHPKVIMLFCTLFFLFLPFCYSFAQQPQWQLNYSTGNWTDFLYDLHFTGAQYGWVVGDGLRKGIFLMTKDAGNNWIEVQDSLWNSKIILSVFFTDTLTGWVITDDGKILKSNDGGYSWGEISQVDTAVSFGDLYFRNHLEGWIVGGNIIINPGGQIESGFIKRTIDGGNSWHLVNFDSTIVKTQIRFSDSLHGLVVGWHRHIYTTHDGGITWGRNTNFNTDYSFNTCTTLNDSTFVLAGSLLDGNGFNLYPLFGKSTDYGSTWEFNVWQTNQAETFLSVGFSDELNGWFGSYDGKFIFTNDGGLTFHFDSAGTDQDIWGIRMINENQGWAYGGKAIFKYDIVTSIPTARAQSSLTLVPYLKAYPNPFNHKVEFEFELLKSSNINIMIFDISGRKIIELMNAYEEPGSYSTTWDGTDKNDNPVASGIYFTILRTPTLQKTTKIFYIK